MHCIFRHNFWIFTQIFCLPQMMHPPLLSNTSRQPQVCLMAFLYNTPLCWKVTVTLINTEALFRSQLPDAWSSSDTDSTEVTPQVGDTTLHCHLYTLFHNASPPFTWGPFPRASLFSPCFYTMLPMPPGRQYTPRLCYRSFFAPVQVTRWSIANI